MPNSTIDEIRKRLKPDDGLQSHWTPEGYLRKDKSLLPPEIWSHIFTFCVPRVLGLLLPVNKAFHAYLDPSASGNSHEPLSRSVLKILTPETIWRASRHLHLPGTPGPLAGRTELDMWKLACGTFANFAGRKDKQIPHSQWTNGTLGQVRTASFQSGHLESVPAAPVFKSVNEGGQFISS
jgi:hypothetical protein